MWTIVLPDQNPLPLETITGHHDAVAMQGINQQSIGMKIHGLAQHEESLALRKARSCGGTM